MMIWQPEKVIVPEMRTCRYCGKILSGTRRKYVCGGKRCLTQARHEGYVKHIDQYKKKSKLNGTKYPHTCPTCGVLFHGAKNQIYCNRKCVRLKMHVYHDQIIQLMNEGMSLREIALQIDEYYESVKYYYNKHIKVDD